MPQVRSDTLLQVDGLTVSYRIEEGGLRVVRELGFSIRGGEIVGLMGESGCGKTTAALAMLGLLPPGAEVSGSVRFQGTELIGAGPRALQQIRGARVSIILQEPSLSLNPVIRVVDQVAEVLRAHQPMSGGECRRRAEAALEQAGLEGERLHRSYPHQLSGGQRQRVLIAQAIVCGPSLVIADEPTGALDAIAALEILRLLHDLVRRVNASLLLITHDPRVLSAMADRVMVMYAGALVEAGPAAEVLGSPRHPYTRGLLRCLRDPRRDALHTGDRHVPAIPGAAPDFRALPPGCPFEPRCEERLAACAATPPVLLPVDSRQVRCLLYGR